MFVRLPAWNNSYPNGRILEKFDIYVFRKFVEKIQISLKSDKNTGTLHEDVFTFMTISRSILLRMRNVLDKSCRENQNTHSAFNICSPKIESFMRRLKYAVQRVRPFYVSYILYENCAVYDIISKNMVDPWRPQMTIQDGACALQAG